MDGIPHPTSNNVCAPDYVLMTAAHNEESYIEKTITSVLAQTILPKQWVIVSDGSTDRTDAIVENYAKENPLISFLKLSRPEGRNFGSKGMALKNAWKVLEKVRFDFIGNVDADIALAPEYFESLFKQFRNDPQLGIAAGFIYEKQAGEFRNRAANRTYSVPHAAQIVRGACYEAIGGYSIFKYGGEDWYAQQCAKMKGWQVRTFPELKVFHYRSTGGASNPLRSHFRAGQSDYSFGSDPVFEILKCGRRVFEKPWLLGAGIRLLGFAWSSITREQRTVSAEFVEFLRREQRARLSQPLT
jgi:glycosyltransferase involved in cell wall biosynthesis